MKKKEKMHMLQRRLRMCTITLQLCFTKTSHATRIAAAVVAASVVADVAVVVPFHFFIFYSTLVQSIILATNILNLENVFLLMYGGFNIFFIVSKQDLLL